jgi:hypothetical protein
MAAILDPTDRLGKQGMSTLRLIANAFRFEITSQAVALLL